MYVAYPPQSQTLRTDAFGTFGTQFNRSGPVIDTQAEGTSYTGKPTTVEYILHAP